MGGGGWPLTSFSARTDWFPVVRHGSFKKRRKKEPSSERPRRPLRPAPFPGLKEPRSAGSGALLRGHTARWAAAGEGAPETAPARPPGPLLPLRPAGGWRGRRRPPARPRRGGCARASSGLRRARGPRGAGAPGELHAGRRLDGWVRHENSAGKARGGDRCDPPQPGSELCTPILLPALVADLTSSTGTSALPSGKERRPCAFIRVLFIFKLLPRCIHAEHTLETPSMTEARQFSAEWRRGQWRIPGV